MFYGRGACNYELKKYELAILDFDSALTINSNYELALIYKGASLNEIKKYSEGLVFEDKAIELNPKNESAYYFRSIIKYNLNNYEGSLADCNTALTLKINSIKFTKLLLTQTYSTNDPTQLSYDFYSNLLDLKKT